MCLAVHGRVNAIRDQTGQVDFQGNRRDVNLMLIPEVTAGDWVLVHAGFAISQLDESDARATWQYLTEIAQLEETPDEPDHR